MKTLAQYLSKRWEQPVSEAAASLYMQEEGYSTESEALAALEAIASKYSNPSEPMPDMSDPEEALHYAKMTDPF